MESVIARKAAISKDNISTSYHRPPTYLICPSTIFNQRHHKEIPGALQVKAFGQAKSVRILQVHDVETLQPDIGVLDKKTVRALQIDAVEYSLLETIKIPQAEPVVVQQEEIVGDLIEDEVPQIKSAGAEQIETVGYPLLEIVETPQEKADRTLIIEPLVETMGGLQSKATSRQGLDEQCKKKLISEAIAETQNGCCSQLAGVYEVEHCYESGPAWKNYYSCKKNPGHGKFISVGEFGPGHMPVECRDARVVRYIKMASGFTVRLLTNYTCADRPDGYPRAPKGGLFASGVAGLPGNTGPMPCPLKDCPYKKGKHNVYGYIRILTNKHVVYSLAEALETKAQFFYDNDRLSDDERLHSESAWLNIAQCMGLEYSAEDNDVAHLQCVTHDEELYNTLCKNSTKLTDVYKSIPPEVWQSCRDLCVVISHPHGIPKMISVGKHVDFKVTSSRAHAHFHNGATCPGSSGAPVYYVCLKENGNHSMFLPAIHSYYCPILEVNCAFK